MEQANESGGGAHHSSKKLIVALAIVFLLISAVLIWIYYLRPVEDSSEQTLGDESSGFGAEIFEQSQNPVKDKIPEGGSPVANPVKDSYKNPFE